MIAVSRCSRIRRFALGQGGRAGLEEGGVGVVELLAEDGGLGDPDQGQGPLAGVGDRSGVEEQVGRDGAHPAAGAESPGPDGRRSIGRVRFGSGKARGRGEVLIPSRPVPGRAQAAARLAAGAGRAGEARTTSRCRSRRRCRWRAGGPGPRPVDV